jgi:hypothetical protein
MKVFISWSGDRSKAVAEVLDEWLQCVLQAVDPWMSSKDIDRGSLWFSEISDQLADTKLGIVCLTKDNKTKPWILFEAGALAKGLSSARVCTFLIDLEPTDVGNPLAQFNHTHHDKDGVFELLRTINSSLGEKALKEKVLERVFDTYWPQFESGFQDALKDNPPTGPIEERTEENMTLEVLTAIRRLERKVRDIDNSNSHRPIDPFAAPSNARKRNMFGPSEAKKLAREFIDSGAPNGIVEDMLEEKGVPSRAAKNIIMEIREENEMLGVSDTES